MKKLGKNKHVVYINTPNQSLRNGLNLEEIYRIIRFEKG